MKKIRGEDRLINNNYFGFKFCKMEGGEIKPFYVNGPIPPASIRKPKVFWGFQWLKKWHIGLKWIQENQKFILKKLGTQEMINLLT